MPVGDDEGQQQQRQPQNPGEAMDPTSAKIAFLAQNIISLTNQVRCLLHSVGFGVGDDNSSVGRGDSPAA